MIRRDSFHTFSVFCDVDHKSNAVALFIDNKVIHDLTLKRFRKPASYSALFASWRRLCFS